MYNSRMYRSIILYLKGQQRGMHIIAGLIGGSHFYATYFPNSGVDYLNHERDIEPLGV